MICVRHFVKHSIRNQAANPSLVGTQKAALALFNLYMRKSWRNLDGIINLNKYGKHCEGL